MSKKLKVFKLSMKKWLRAGNNRNWSRANGNSRLYEVESHSYCCLGMFAVHCGVSRKKIRDEGTPSDVFNRYEDAPEDFRPLLTKRNASNSRITVKAMAINDLACTTDEQKIRKLRPLFRKLGYRIEVVP